MEDFSDGSGTPLSMLDFLTLRLRRQGEVCVPDSLRWCVCVVYVAQKEGGGMEREREEERERARQCGRRQLC